MREHVIQMEPGLLPSVLASAWVVTVERQEQEMKQMANEKCKVIAESFIGQGGLPQHHQSGVDFPVLAFSMRLHFLVQGGDMLLNSNGRRQRHRCCGWK